MLIHLLGLEQFNQKVSENPVWPHPEWLKGSGMRNETQTTPKWS
jgi:hypothetical protein